MPRNVTKIRIFIASPSDTTDERNLASEVVSDLNRINISDNVELELIKWETHTYSGIGEDAQDVINSQIDDDYDIFVGVMWKRFGSPTKRAASGTEEEFLRALELHKSKTKPIKILFYFSQTPIPPKEIDVEQLQKINNFKNQLGEYGVYYWEYTDPKEFERLFRVQISKTTKELLGELNIPKAVQKIEVNDEDSDEDEAGLFDLIEEFTEEFSEIESVLTRMTELMTELGEKMNRRAEEINSVNMKIMKPQDISKLIDKASNDLQVYVRRMKTEMPIFSESMAKGFDSLAKAYSIYYADWSVVSEEEKESFRKIEDLNQSMYHVKEQMHALKLQIGSIPRVTKNFNKAKKDTEKVLKDLIREIDSALNQVNEIKKLREGESN
jgi:hypothetical protein